MTNLIKSFCALPAAATTRAIVGALALALPLAGLAPATPAAAQTSEARQLDRAVQALRGITTLQADFTQADRNGSVVAGKLTLKNPGKIRFEYTDDVNMLVVANGNSLTFIDYDANQLDRWPIRNSPLGALLDPERDLRRYGTLLPTSSPNVVSIEVSDPEKPEFGVITLIFVTDPAAPGGLELTSWVALDSQNARTTVRLANHRYGAAVADSAFRYRDPRRTSRRPR